MAGNKYVHLLRTNRLLRLLLCANMSSWLGDVANIVATLVAIQAISTRSMAVTIYMICRLVPPIVMGPSLGGVLADRYDKRQIMIVINGLLALVTLGYILAYALKSLAVIYVVTVLKNGIAAVYDPCSSALIPAYASEAEIVVANTLLNGLWSATLLIGAGIGGVVVSAVGVNGCYVFDVLSFVCSLAFLMRMWRADIALGNPGAIGGGKAAAYQPVLADEEGLHGTEATLGRNTSDRGGDARDGDDDGRRALLENVQDGPKTLEEITHHVTATENPFRTSAAVLPTMEEFEAGATGSGDRQPGSIVTGGGVAPVGARNPLQMFGDGLSYLRAHPFVFTLVFMKGSGAIQWGGVEIANIALAGDPDEFQWGDDASKTLALLNICVGVGVGCGSVIGDWYAGGKAVRVRRVIVAAATAVCLGVALLAWSPHIVFYLAGNVLRTSGGGCLWVFSSVWLQELVPEKMRGRVFAFDFGIYVLAEMLSMLVAGLVVDKAGWSPRQLYAFELVIAACVLVWWVYYLFLGVGDLAAKVPDIGGSKEGSAANDGAAGDGAAGDGTATRSRSSSGDRSSGHGHWLVPQAAAGSGISGRAHGGAGVVVTLSSGDDESIEISL